MTPTPNTMEREVGERGEEKYTCTSIFNLWKFHLLLGAGLRTVNPGTEEAEAGGSLGV